MQGGSFGNKPGLSCCCCSSVGGAAWADIITIIRWPIVWRGALCSRHMLQIIKATRFFRHLYHHHAPGDHWPSAGVPAFPDYLPGCSTAGWDRPVDGLSETKSLQKKEIDRIWKFDSRKVKGGVPFREPAQEWCRWWWMVIYANHLAAHNVSLDRQGSPARVPTRGRLPSLYRQDRGKIASPTL